MITMITFVSTMGGGLIALQYLERYQVITAFAAGVLIAVPLFDLLPESLNLAVEQGRPLIQVMYVVALGFIFLLVLERYIFVHPHGEVKSAPTSTISWAVGWRLGDCPSIPIWTALPLVWAFSSARRLDR